MLRFNEISLKNEEVYKRVWYGEKMKENLIEGFQKITINDEDDENLETKSLESKDYEQNEDLISDSNPAHSFIIAIIMTVIFTISSIKLMESGKKIKQWYKTLYLG